MSAAISVAKLAEIRAAAPDCTLALWSDVRSGTVLAADGDLEHPQEYLNAISRVAADALALGGPPREAGTSVLLAGETGLHLFLRGAGAEDVVLTCLAPRDADLERLKSAAWPVVTALAPEVHVP